MKVIYRLYDADDRLLYVGCTGDLTRRLHQHRSRQTWARDVARAHVTDCATLAMPPFTAEQFIIRKERPLYNKGLSEAMREAWPARRARAEAAAS